MKREWRKVEGMGRNELIVELKELRKFYEDNVDWMKCDCTCGCESLGVSCRNRCMKCEEEDHPEEEHVPCCTMETEEIEP